MYRISISSSSESDEILLVPIVDHDTEPDIMTSTEPRAARQQKHETSSEESTTEASPQSSLASETKEFLAILAAEASPQSSLSSESEKALAMRLYNLDTEYETSSSVATDRPRKKKIAELKGAANDSTMESTSTSSSSSESKDILAVPTVDDETYESASKKRTIQYATRSTTPRAEASSSVATARQQKKKIAEGASNQSTIEVTSTPSSSSESEELLALPTADDETYEPAPKMPVQHARKSTTRSAVTTVKPPVPYAKKSTTHRVKASPSIPRDRQQKSKISRLQDLSAGSAVTTVETPVPSSSTSSSSSESKDILAVPTVDDETYESASKKRTIQYATKSTTPRAEASSSLATARQQKKKIAELKGASNQSTIDVTSTPSSSSESEELLALPTADEETYEPAPKTPVQHAKKSTTRSAVTTVKPPVPYAKKSTTHRVKASPSIPRDRQQKSKISRLQDLSAGQLINLVLTIIEMHPEIKHEIIRLIKQII